MLEEVILWIESYMMHQDVRNLEPNQHHAAVLKLMGVGGGGCNAIEHMVAADIHGLQFTCVNTDAQALAQYHPDDVIQLGTGLTRGLGAGADPEMGRLAAEEDKDRIAEAIGDADLLFLTAGMGGGTGTGAVPVVARIARELGVLTVAVVTKPFAFEGDKRRGVANDGIEKLRQQVDSLIVVPNENLLSYLGPNTPLIDAFAASNDILTNAVQSIAELITTTGLINVDFADVKSVMTEAGQAMMSTGRGLGEHRARDAAIAAIESPLLDDIDLSEARGILANVTASSDLSMGEFHVVGEIISGITADDANVVIGTVFDQRMKHEMRVTVVATGLNSHQYTAPKTLRAEKRKNKKGVFGSRVEGAKPGVAKGRKVGATKLTRSAQELPAKREVCYLCEQPDGTHSLQCPLGERSATAKSQPIERGQMVRRVSATETTRSRKKPPVNNKTQSASQKLSVAGLLAGILVLISIFYSIASNKIADGYDQIVSSDRDAPSIAPQGERSPNQSLSRIED